MAFTLALGLSSTSYLRQAFRPSASCELRVTCRLQAGWPSQLYSELILKGLCCGWGLFARPGRQLAAEAR